MFNESSIDGPRDEIKYPQLEEDIRVLVKQPKLFETCIVKWKLLLFNDPNLPAGLELPHQEDTVAFVQALWKCDPIAHTAISERIQELRKRGEYLLHDNSRAQAEELKSVQADFELLSRIHNFSGATPPTAELSLLDELRGRLVESEELGPAVVDRPFLEDSPSDEVTGESAHATSAEPALIEAADADIVILPPDKYPRLEPSNSSGVYIEPKPIPRNQALKVVLQELGLQYSFEPGTVPEDSMRTLPYNGYIITMEQDEQDGSTKIVFVDDEFGEATYIVHAVADANSEFKNLATKTKSELRALGPDKVTRVVYPGDIDAWKEIVINHLHYTEDDLKHVIEFNQRGNFVGHISANGMCKLLKREYKIGIAPDTIQKIADSVSISEPFASIITQIESREGISHAKASSKLFTPDFSEYMLQLCVSLSKPNEQWRQVGGILKDAKSALQQVGLNTALDHETVNKALEEVLAISPTDEPEKIWESRFYLGKGVPPVDSKLANNIFGLHEHFSPAVCQAVIEKLVRETAPTGWQTVNKIEADLNAEGIKVNSVRVWAELTRLQPTSPNFVFEYYRGTGVVRRTDHDDPRGANPRLRLYASPDLVAAVKASIRIQQ